MSQQSARTNYLQGEVLTATPQKLQLLLVEAAIKNIHRTKKFWLDSDYDGAFESLTRAQDIIAEILCSFDIENQPDLAKKLASIYMFIFRRLTEAGMSFAQDKLDDALRVLDSERETWRQVCEKFGSTVTETSSTSKTSSGGDAWSSASPVSPSPQYGEGVQVPGIPAHRGSASLEITSGASPVPTPGTPGNFGPLAPPNSVKPIPASKPLNQNAGFSWDA